MLSKISLPLNDKAIAGDRQLNKAFFLADGDVCDVLIKEKIGSTKYLVNLKNQEVLLESPVSLNPGDKISVAIAQIRPQIVLAMLNQESQLPPIAKEYLTLALLNHDALMDIFKNGLEFIGHGLKGFLLPDAEKNILRNIQSVIESLIFSPKTCTNPLFVKDYILNLGLLLETDLLKKSGAIKGTDKDEINEGLKGAFIKLSQDMRALSDKGKIGSDEEARQLAEQLAKFADASVKAIETQQLINVFRRDYDGAYVVQIPLFFDSGIRTGEIYIDPGVYEGHAEENLTNSRIVMFLSLDALGNMIVEVTLAGQSINCMFKFEDREMEDYFYPFLNNLVSGLRDLGYSANCSTCCMEHKMEHIRNEYRSALFNERDTVNLFA